MGPLKDGRPKKAYFLFSLSSCCSLYTSTVPSSKKTRGASAGHSPGSDGGGRWVPNSEMLLLFLCA